MISWSNTLIGGAVVCLILLTVGFAFLAGMWLGRRRKSEQSDSAEDPERMADMINGLYHWTSGIARDVTEYRGAVGRLAEHVDGMQVAGATTAEDGISIDAPPASLDPESINAFHSAHSDMQDRLSSAEATLKKQADEIQIFVNEARCDALTGVANRRAFDDEMSRRFAEWRRHGVPLCLLLVDVDHFKNFNDEHGHLAGDAVLKTTAERLTDAMRTSDMVTRYGGEEFAIILVQSHLPDACRAAERACSCIDDLDFSYENKSLRVTVSCGLAQATGDESIAHLIHRADKALYAAKDAGRNVAYWNDGERCVPITPKRIELPPRLVRKSEEIPPKFANVCSDLRQRLADISGGKA